jgi:hypothetical protein
VLFQVFVHVEEGDSGLNQGESSFNIHFKNLVHVASKIESNAAGPSPADTTATNIPFDRERPDRYLELVAQTHDSLYVWCSSWRDDSGANKVFLAKGMERIMYLAGL